MKKLNLTLTPLSDWLPPVNRPIVISGPCGAETEEQVLNTAHEIAKLGRVSIFRSGIWKPRTRPDSFEGVGTKGLKWLKKVKEETSLLTTVEVANAQHAYEALKHGVDILWIGARTTVNPFSVQEIADAIAGADIPVMVKNPVHPDLQLWIGALERINKAGITKLIAIHRGFHNSSQSKYRNAPQWEIPIELKTSCPELPLICDPSHICGRTNLLQQVAQKALDLDFAGLMIESHISPATALSDAKQQVTPAGLGELLSSLIIRNPDSSSTDFANRLEQLRSIIDEIDEELIESLGKRMGISRKIGEYKRDNNVTILQVKRWEDIIRKHVGNSEQLGLSGDFVKAIFTAIHKESIRKQTEVMNQPVNKLAE